MPQYDTELKENRMKKRDLLARMLELTKQEKQHLSTDDLDALLETTKQWSAVAAEIDALEQAFQAILQKTAEEDRQFPFDEINDEMTQLLNQINQLQKESYELANEKIDQYKTDLKTVKRSNMRVTSYSNPYTANTDGIYFDTKK